MQLSIGMIVKNEEKYLEQCLEALRPLRDAVECELIITDTGSTDRTVEIAEKYADKLLHYAWNNDFSAARNTTIDAASGEWYMFLDADEIMQDSADLISFFRTDAHIRDNTATVIIRSYSDTADPTIYHDFRALRLIKTSVGARFENPVHEALTPPSNPCGVINTVFRHYGYMFYTNGVPNELAREKCRRNLELLFAELRESEKNGSLRSALYQQISNAYSIVGDHENALRYAEAGLGKCAPDSFAVFGYYCACISALIQLGRNNEVRALCDKYFSAENAARTKTLATDAFILGMRALAYFRLGDPEKSISDFLSCFRLHRRVVANELVTEDLMVQPYALSMSVIRSCYEGFFRACVAAKKWKTAADQLREIPIEDYYGDSNFMITFLGCELRITEQTDFRDYAKLYERLDRSNRLQLVRMTRWYMFVTERPAALIKALSQQVNNEPLMNDITEIYKRCLVEQRPDREQITRLLDNYTARENEDIWCLMLRSGFDIAPYIRNDGFEARRCVTGVIMNYIEPRRAFGLFEDYPISAISPAALETASEVYGCALVEAAKRGLDITALLTRYGEVGARWFDNFPNDDPYKVPGNIMAALMVNEIMTAYNSGDYKTCAEEMRRMAKKCPDFVPLLKQLREKLSGRIASAAAQGSELRSLAEQAKQVIRELLNTGDITTAETTLAELRTLSPNDPELDVIAEEIRDMKNRI